MAKKHSLYLQIQTTGTVRDGQPMYKYDFKVDGEEGVEFFCMLVEFLHACPPWVLQHVEMAVDFNREHDRANCPHCRSQS